jgi:hypothetical protein
MEKSAGGDEKILPNQRLSAAQYNPMLNRL